MVYLIIEETKTYCKIGYCKESEGLEHRLQSLQIGNPNKLYVVHFIEGTIEDEKKFHEEFRHFHKLGEWFLFMPEIIEKFQSFPQNKIPIYYTNYKSSGTMSEMSSVLKRKDLIKNIKFPCSATDFDQQLIQLINKSSATAINLRKKMENDGIIYKRKRGKETIYYKL